MKKDISKLIECPVCKFSWDAGDIFDTLVKQDWWKSKMTEDELRQYVKNNYSYPYKFSRIIGIEDSNKYDGVSFWSCPDCHSIWDRFTNKLIEIGKSNEIKGNGN